MIKTGITGGESAAAGELIRILINHPDVDLRWVESHPLSGRRVEHEHKGLTGELEMVFTSHGDTGEVDLVFACGDNEPAGDHLRVVTLHDSHLLDDNQETYVYGLPEVNRRRTVHDCYRVACPSPVATAIALALLPLAKNLMLADDIRADVLVSNDARPSALTADELRLVIGRLQLSHDGSVDVHIIGTDEPRVCRAIVTLDCACDLQIIKELFVNYYDDHNLTHVASRPVDSRDVTNTAKALIYIERDDDRRLKITTVLDPALKGAAGAAVHNMNLLFGLHERVGLALKGNG